jgi:hypothetical protein
MKSPDFIQGAQKFSKARKRKRGANLMVSFHHRLAPAFAAGGILPELPVTHGNRKLQSG